MAKKNETENITKLEKEAVNLTKELIDLIGVKADIKVIINEGLVEINIEGEDLGLLIGYRGENIESLQLLLGLIINKKLGFDEWRPVVVDLGGWRKQREEALKVLVEKEIGKLDGGQESVDLPPMPPTQRRSVHILIGTMKGYSSESSGEGNDRHIVIKKLAK